VGLVVVAALRVAVVLPAVVAVHPVEALAGKRIKFKLMRDTMAA